jgi:nucleoside-diphosphate-sugar epimerase
MKKIAIIGGSGFIGSRLAFLLKYTKKYSFKIIDKTASKIFPELTTVADVRELNQLRDAIPINSIIVNLAAEHQDNITPKSLYRDVNVFGAENICLVAREKKINTIIFTSSVAVYGFAPKGTRESGKILPFNEYGKTKYEAEKVFNLWQSESPNTRTLVIIRPTVVFGEKNRGNVYNLLRQIASKKFIMVGNGKNLKSMAYVDNLTAFICHCLNFKPGIHTYNFVDKPDFTMNKLVNKVNNILGFKKNINFKIPYLVGLVAGKVFDVISFLSGKSFFISAIRIKKFCANSTYRSAIKRTGFVSPISINSALERTIRSEFIVNADDKLNSSSK